MTDIDIKKTKFKLEIWTFITICVVVFWLWVTWASIKSTQTQIIAKLDELEVQQEQMIATRDLQHKIIDSQLAWISPTLQRIAKIEWVDIFTN